MNVSDNDVQANHECKAFLCDWHVEVLGYQKLSLVLGSCCCNAGYMIQRNVGRKTLFTMQCKGYDIECTQSVLLLQLCLCYADGELVLLNITMRAFLRQCQMC